MPFTVKLTLLNEACKNYLIYLCSQENFILKKSHMGKSSVFWEEMPVF